MWKGTRTLGIPSAAFQSAVVNTEIGVLSWSVVRSHRGAANRTRVVVIRVGGGTLREGL